MDLTTIREALEEPHRFDIHVFDRLDSTNRYLYELGRRGAPQWTVAVAEQQTAGRGRYQRRWASPPGVGLWFSLLLRPSLPIQEINLVNLFTAISLADFLSRTCQTTPWAPLDIRLKWPNDLIVQNRKLSGILLEGSFAGDRPEYLVVGIGLNVNHQEEDFPPELRERAVSLRMITGREWNREQLLAGFLEHYYETYHYYFPGRRQEVVEAYEKRLAFRNQPITVEDARGRFSGVFRRLTAEGYLVVETEGKERIITTGDVFQNLFQNSS
ncbi:MAG: biotin--[acetyl-CoA-carboxylase] ligase [Calditrichaeota bacterium]|nr:MAG: biotin--[acetyl-CoA-carboxylase] ligase [Calditrichota bacterium]